MLFYKFFDWFKKLFLIKLNFIYKLLLQEGIYIFIDNFGSLNNSWKRGNFQRNYIQKALDVAGPEDMILISDADEIPNLQGLNFDTLNEFKYLVF